MKLTKLITPEFRQSVERLSRAEVPMRTAFKLRGIIKQINDQIAKYEDTRIETLKKYVGTKDDGTTLNVDDKNQAIFKSDEDKIEYLKELGELMMEDVTVDKLAPTDLGERLHLSTADLMQMEELFT